MAARGGDADIPEPASETKIKEAKPAVAAVADIGLTVPRDRTDPPAVAAAGITDAVRVPIVIGAIRVAAAVALCVGAPRRPTMHPRRANTRIRAPPLPDAAARPQVRLVGGP